MKNNQKTVADLKSMFLKFDSSRKIRNKEEFEDQFKCDNHEFRNYVPKIIPNRYKFRIFLSNIDTYIYEWYEFYIITVFGETLIDLLYLINYNISNITNEITGFGMYLEKFNQIEETTFEIELGIPF